MFALAASQCVHPMSWNYVWVMKVMSEDPPPFISTGKLQKFCERDNFSHFIPKIVVCDRVTTSHMRPNGREDMNILC